MYGVCAGEDAWSLVVVTKVQLALTHLACRDWKNPSVEVCIRVSVVSQRIIIYYYYCRGEILGAVLCRLRSWTLMLVLAAFQFRIYCNDFLYHIYLKKGVNE